MVLVAWTVALACLFAVPPSSGTRYQTDLGTRKGEEDGLSAGGSETFRVFATTFNTGNADSSKDYSKDQTDHLLKALTQGHDDPGEEADLIIIGLQEFRDYRSSLGMEAKNSYAWKSLSEKKMKEVAETVNKVAKIPDNIQGVKENLHGDFRAFHEKLSNQLETFRKGFGEASEPFHKHLADESKLSTWEDQTMTKEVDTLLHDRMQEQKKTDIEAPNKQFQDFASAVEDLKKVSKTHPSVEQIKDALLPIREWTKSALQDLKRLREKYPNILYTEVGDNLWKNLVKKIDRVDSLQQRLFDNNNQQAGLESDMNSLLADVKKSVSKDEQSISNQLDKDVSAISRAVEKLNNDLKDMVQNGNKYQAIASSAGRATRPWEHSLEQSLSKWKSSIDDTFDELLEQASFQMSHGHFEVEMGIHKFQSGGQCHMVNHYDTIIYVLQNPWSEWKITPQQYSSIDKCKKSESASTNMGCTINNGKSGGECGKVVNVMVFKAEKGTKEFNICALNTHMSFKGEATQRMQYIKEAIEESRHAQCDTVVFVGDFNSRMHCDDDIDSLEAEIPPYERVDKKTNSSFKYIIDNICPGGTCTLKGLDEKVQYYDELMQMMGRDTLNCREKKKKKVSMFKTTEEWVNVDEPNSLKNFNIAEAAVPDWAPTYKVAPKSKASQLPQHFCPDKNIAGSTREESCFMNKGGAGKHNPAWTDRILVSSQGTKAVPKTTAYLRRLVDPDLNSDHLPVVAKVEIAVSEK